MAGVNKRISRATHNHGVEIPNSVDHVKRLDEKNDNVLQMETINKEMENLKVDVDVLEYGNKIVVVYHKASGHLGFDIRVTLEYKARWVKYMQKTLKLSRLPFLVSCKERFFLFH